MTRVAINRNNKVNVREARSNAKHPYLGNSTWIDFVEDIAKNETIAQSKTELLFCGFFREDARCDLVHLP